MVSILSKCAFSAAVERLSGCLRMSKHNNITSCLYMRPALLGECDSYKCSKVSVSWIFLHFTCVSKSQSNEYIPTWQLSKFKQIVSIIFIFKDHRLPLSLSDQRKKILLYSGICIGSAKSQIEVAQETCVKRATSKFPCM